MRYLAYYYPSWHNDERHVYNNFEEWGIVINANSAFMNHAQPNHPLWGPIDISEKSIVRKQVKCAKDHGINGFIVIFYWDNSRVILDRPLDILFDIADEMDDFEIGLMWVNRAPHFKLPISIMEYQNNDYNKYFKDREVFTNEDDLNNLFTYCSKKYFSRRSYLKIKGRCYFSIFSFRKLLADISSSKMSIFYEIRRKIMDEFNLELFICPIAHGCEEWIDQSVTWGFDALTSYVLLPDWEGPFLQDYFDRIKVVYEQWFEIARKSSMPYFPSVTCGWDSSPRGLENANESFREYPWHPIIINNNLKFFKRFIRLANQFSFGNNYNVVIFTSWNEWSEGHFLEPDKKNKYKKLNAIKAVKGKF